MSRTIRSESCEPERKRRQRFDKVYPEQEDHVLPASAQEQWEKDAWEQYQKDCNGENYDQ